MTSIALIGGGGHAKVVVSILRKLGSFKIVGYTAPQDGGDLMGVPYLGGDDRIVHLLAGHSSLSAVIAVGQVGLGDRRHSIWKSIEMFPISLPAIVSPRAIVNEGVTVGEGSVVMDGAVVNSGASIGRGAIINSNSTVEHDVVLDEWTHVAPGATISGGVTVGSFSMIGAGATVIEGKKIGSRCLIGAGSTVVHDLDAPGVYAGSPARLIRK